MNILETTINATICFVVFLVSWSIDRKVSLLQAHSPAGYELIIILVFVIYENKVGCSRE